MTAHQDSLLVQRQKLLDRAREIHAARTSSNIPMKDRVLTTVETSLYETCEWLWQASQHKTIAVAGDLKLADRLAAVQQRWNAGQVGDAMDALLEAYGHMRQIQVDLLEKREEAA